MSKNKLKKPSQPLESQEDFWDLGDDELDPKLGDHAEKQAPFAEDIAYSPPAEKEKKEVAPELDGDLRAQESPPTPEETKVEDERIHKKEGPPSEPTKDSSPLSLIEKISLGIVVACLVGAVSWGISAFFREAPQGEAITFKEEYPAKGQNITIASVETWWRKPVRTGEDADIGVTLESRLIPSARIKLADSSSTTLRVSFRNGEKQLIGDTINLTVKDGKFARSGSDEVEIFSTAGFGDPSTINSYANEDIAPWTLIISEGNGGNESEPLVKARISTLNRN